jgi:hypothetical protein
MVQDPEIPDRSADLEIGVNMFKASSFEARASPP